MRPWLLALLLPPVVFPGPAPAGEPREVALHVAYGLLEAEYGGDSRIDIVRSEKISTDMTCDGVPDLVFGWRDRIDREGEFFNLAVATNPGSGPRLKTLRIPIASGKPAALCDNRGVTGSRYRLEAKPMNPGLRAAAPMPLACTMALTIDDMICNVLWIAYEPFTGRFILDRK